MIAYCRGVRGTHQVPPSAASLETGNGPGVTHRQQVVKEAIGFVVDCGSHVVHVVTLLALAHQSVIECAEEAETEPHTIWQLHDALTCAYAQRGGGIWCDLTKVSSDCVEDGDTKAGDATHRRRHLLRASKEAVTASRKERVGRDSVCGTQSPSGFWQGGCAWERRTCVARLEERETARFPHFGAD